MQNKINGKLLVKPNQVIQELSPYKVAKQDLWRTGIANIYKLDWNEESFINNRVHKKIIDFINQGLYCYYPDASGLNLRQKIASTYNIDTENIMIYNGSDEALDDVCRIFLNKGDTVTFMHPEYSNFEVFSLSTGAKNIPFLSDKPFEDNFDQFKDHIRNLNPKLVYISNPNNPTGKYLSSEKLIPIVREFEKTLFIIDEAYINFTTEEDENYWIQNINHYQNVCVTRTFSKLFSVAGLRIGYLVANNEILNLLKRIHKSKNINMIAQVAAEAALDDIDYYRLKVEDVKVQKNRFIAEVKNLNFIESVYDSKANFVCIKLKSKVSEFLMYLEQHGIYVRDRSSIINLSQIIRVTINDNMDYPLEIMSKFNDLNI